MSKFIQPVSMVVTKEQYERDLRKPLLDMGYEEGILGDFRTFPVLITSFKNNSVVTNVAIDFIANKDYYFIDHYNPKLFLAIAAMTNESYGIIGEWWRCVEDGCENFDLNKLYISQKPLNEMFALIDKYGNGNGYWGENLRYFTKATLQELVAEFTISKPNPTTDTISIPSDSIKSLNNLLDMPKDTLNNELINAVQGLLSLAHSYYNDEDITRGNECMNSISRLINNLDLE